MYLLLLFLGTFSILGHSGALPREVLEKIPKEVDLTNPIYEMARTEIEEAIQNCGMGVFRGVGGENRCHFDLDLNALYFHQHSRQAGLLYERNWAYQDGVTFYEPLARKVPDNFDLRQLMRNGEPDLRTQKCGDCWAWATHHGLEIARAVHDGEVFDHSIQTILSCSRKGSCAGGYMSAVDFLLKGLPLESEFPYAGRDSSCPFKSHDLSSGWNPKAEGTPYVGNSLDHSLAFRDGRGANREGAKVEAMMAAMYEWKTPLVVTVASYQLSAGQVYDSCSAINSGGNHMVDIVGWEMWEGKRVAHVWNSHGKQHGDNGVSRIVWECGQGRLNRGLGYAAKIVQYKAPCVPPQASQIYLHEVLKGKTVQVGAPQKTVTTECSWTPREGLSNPDSCVTEASPSETTEYHLTAKNGCGTSSSMTLVHVWGTRGEKSREVLTPFGRVQMH